jgi:hypothetical protein
MKEKVNVLWSSGDKDVAKKLVFMYTLNSKIHGWWDEVRLIVWGPSANLLANDEELSFDVKKMIEKGIEVVACKACSDSYNVSDKLANLGIEVKYMGKDLTSILKENEKLITF